MRPVVTEAGVIYFVQSGEELGPVKIGYSLKVQERMRSLQTGHPYPLRLIGVIPGDMNDEKRFHARFRAERISGEWFSYSGRVAAAIEEIFGKHASSTVDAAVAAAKARTGRFAERVAKAISVREAERGQKIAVAEVLVTALRRGATAAWREPRYPLCCSEEAGAILMLAQVDLEYLRRAGELPFWEGICGDVKWHRRRVERVGEETRGVLLATRQTLGVIGRDEAQDEAEFLPPRLALVRRAGGVQAALAAGRKGNKT